MIVDLLKLKEKDPAAYGLTRASLIQKLIRRSMLPEALWVTKLFIDDGHSKGLHRRLLQIAAEDIGLSLPNAINLLSNEPDLYKQTAYLCLANKNREVDRFLLSIAYNEDKFKNHEDQNVRNEYETLQKLINLSSLWFNNKRKKEPLVNLQNEFLNLSKTSDYPETVLKSLDIYLELSRHNVHGARVMLALATLLSCRKIDSSNIIIPDVNNLPEMKECNPVPDYALDMHTPAGRMMNRGFNHWVKEGAVVFPEVFYESMYDEKKEEKYPLVPLLPFLKALK